MHISAPAAALLLFTCTTTRGLIDGRSATEGLCDGTDQTACKPSSSPMFIGRCTRACSACRARLADLTGACARRACSCMQYECSVRCVAHLVYGTRQRVAGAGGGTRCRPCLSLFCGRKPWTHVGQGFVPGSCAQGLCNPAPLLMAGALEGLLPAAPFETCGAVLDSCLVVELLVRSCANLNS